MDQSIIFGFFFDQYEVRTSQLEVQFIICAGVEHPPVEIDEILARLFAFGAF
jgi:hypothetical protein